MPSAPGDPRPKDHRNQLALNQSYERQTMGFSQQPPSLAECARNTVRLIAAKARAALRPFAVVVSVCALGMGLVSVPAVPFLPEPPQADAQTLGTRSVTGAALNNNMGACNFRAGDGPAEPWARQLCWIDMSKPDATDFNWAAGERIIRQIGRYTLAFTARVTYGPANLLKAQDTAWTGSAFGNSNGGVRTFTQYGDDTSKPMLMANMGGTLSSNFVRFNLENIVLRDETGTPVPDFRIMMADAEATTQSGVANEMISMENREGDVERITRITPPGFSDACNAIYGPGQTPNNWSNAGILQRDFICYQNKITSLVPGTFLVSASNPKNLEFGLGSAIWRHQGIALALNLGRVAGSVNSDTTFEKAATNQETNFDITAATRLGTTENSVPLKPGEYTVTTRIPDVGAGGNTKDDYVFRSKATGAQADKAFNRYDPVWTCSIGGASPVTIKQSSVPTGYSLNQNISTNTSELVVQERNNQPTECRVDWEPKFQASSLQLSKTVNGTAASFDENQLRTFQLNYKCTDVNGFATAYPSIPLNGNRILQKGQSDTVANLPLGTTCTIDESFPNGVPPARPGEKLALTWTAGTVSSDPIPTTTTKLDQPSVSIRANNQYDYRAGTLRFSKELAGDPVSQFAYPRKYDFELTCNGTTVKNRPISLNIDRQGTGVPSATVEITDVPVEKDCWLKPLTGLSAEESTRIKFDGRDVTFGGQPISADAAGTYHFRLPDYPEGGTPTTGDLHIKAKYSYQLRDVKVLKELAGNAKSSADLEEKTFPIQYKCTWAGSGGPQNREGTLDVSPGKVTDPARIRDIPVGADCLIWEQNTPEFPNVKLTGTTVSFADTADKTTTLSNDEAKVKPVIKVSTDESDTQNVVRVRNSFDAKIGRVNLNKAVNRNGLSVSLPSDYTFTFNCGPRSVTRSNGQVEYVPLTGKATVGEGGTVALKADVADAELSSLVNDQNGNLGVPYGNECVFNEQSPTLAVTGVLPSNDADQATFTVNQPETTRTVTNDYKATGDGLLITQQSGSNKAFVRRVAYNVQCTASDGTALDMKEYSRVTLGDDPSTAEKEPTSVTIPPSVVPEGSTCEITEDGKDPGTRKKLNGQPGDFPIDRDTEVSVIDKSGAPEPKNFNDLAPVSQTVNVGSQSSVTITHNYDFVYTHVSGAKSVVFDSATEQYISDARKDVKRKREFDVTISCLLPDNPDTPTTDSGKVSAANAGTPLDFGSFPVGSDCTATEGPTTTAAGISVKQEVSFNNGPKSEISKEFDVAPGDNAVTFTNTYSRRLADVKLNKIARLPAAVEQQYRDAGKTPNFYTHTFDMDCRDPETGTGANEALLGTFRSTITGPGTTTFNGVPVGADCHIQGDKFGDLNLELQDKDNTLLKATLRPRKVNWVVDQNDGTAHVDQDLSDGVTESQYFPTVDNGTNGEIKNTVDLTNYYEYVNTKIKMSKKVVGRQADLELLNPNQAFDFVMQCKGVGYQLSELASDGKRIENTISLQNGFSDYADAGNGEVAKNYNSPEVSVPVGAYCSFEEAPPTGTPQELKHTAEQTKIAKYAGSTEDAPVEPWDFVNRYDRRTTPVRVSINQTGYLKGIDPAGYNAKIVCRDPKETAVTKTLKTSEVPVGNNVATAAPVAGGFTVDLPVGAECTMDLSDSPALAPRKELAVTAGARTPATQFNQWVRDKASDQAPRTALALVKPADITEAQKNRQYTFSIPADLSSTESEMVIGAENHNYRGVADVTFTKTSAGQAGENATFAFEQTCSPSDPNFTLKTGQSRTFTGVPIDSPCYVSETDDGVKSSNSVLDVTQHGDRIANLQVEQNPAPAPQPGQPLEENLRRVNFNVLPVADPADTSTSGEGWSLTAQNSFPGVNIEKKIDGSPLSSITGAVADTAVLPDDATSMKMHYTITNTGAQSISDIALKDPSLAGRKLTNSAGQTITVPESGAIDATFCTVNNLQLASGNSHECVFDVEITEPTDQFFKYQGEVTVTASAGAEAGAVSDTDTYGAIRLQKAIGWMLPDTGAQTLLYVLLLGLLALAYGLYRYLRRRDEDEEEDFDGETAEDAHLADEGSFGADANEATGEDSSGHPLDEDPDSPEDYDGQR